jgi:hypothetical protein
MEGAGCAARERSGRSRAGGVWWLSGFEMAADLADALVADGIAVRPFLTRGAPRGDLVSMVIDGVNTGAAIVTFVTAREALRKFAERVCARLRHSDKELVTVTITVPGEAKPRT